MNVGGGDQLSEKIKDVMLGGVGEIGGEIIVEQDFFGRDVSRGLVKEWWGGVVGFFHLDIGGVLS